MALKSSNPPPNPATIAGFFLGKYGMYYYNRSGMKPRTRANLLSHEGIIPESQRKFERDKEARRKSDRKYRKLKRLAAKKGITLEKLLWNRHVDRRWEKTQEQLWPGVRMIYHDRFLNYLCEVIGVQRAHGKARNMAVKILGFHSVNLRTLAFLQNRAVFTEHKMPRGYVLNLPAEHFAKTFPVVDYYDEWEPVSFEDCVLVEYKRSVPTLQNSIDEHGPFGQPTWGGPSSGSTFILRLQQWKKLADEFNVDLLDYKQYSQRLRQATRKNDFDEMLTCIERLVIPDVCPDCKEIGKCETCGGKTLFYPHEKEARTAMVQILDNIVGPKSDREVEDDEEKGFLERIAKAAMSLDLHHEPIKKHEVVVNEDGVPTTIELPAPEHALVLYARAMRGFYKNAYPQIIQHRGLQSYWSSPKITYAQDQEGNPWVGQDMNEHSWTIFKDSVFCGNHCPRLLP